MHMKADINNATVSSMHTGLRQHMLSMGLSLQEKQTSCQIYLTNALPWP